MSDALPLPPRPNLEQYKKLAKDLHRAAQSGEPDAVRLWAVHWGETLARLSAREITPELHRRIERDAGRFAHRWSAFQKNKLADAQFFVARAHGFLSWPKFTAHLQALLRSDSTTS